MTQSSSEVAEGKHLDRVARFQKDFPKERFRREPCMAREPRAKRPRCGRIDERHAILPAFASDSQFEFIKF